MPGRPAFDEPSEVVVIEGEVVVTGPDSVGVSLTPRAALETSVRLRRAAEEAMRASAAPQQA